MRVAVVEDDWLVADSLGAGLLEAGIVADVYYDAEEALRGMRAGPGYDVAILDIGLRGDLDGFGLCQIMRREKHPTAILMLTALDDVGDRLRGFDVGTDDYLAKPFVLDEVLARVRALSRRVERMEGIAGIDVGDVHLDSGLRMVTVHETALELTRREFDLLELLIGHRQRYLGKEQIHDALWSHSTNPQSGLVEVYAGRVRSKLRKAGADQTIQNRRGFGYRLVPCDPISDPT